MTAAPWHVPAIAKKGWFRQGRQLFHLLPKREYRRGLRAGVAAAVEHEDVTFGFEHRTVIDVGAHRGQFALFARRRFPDAQLYCFEPLSTPRRSLQLLLEFDTRARVFPFAVAARSGVEELHVSKLDDSSSLLPITDRYVAAFPGTSEDRTTSIQTFPLDEALAHEEIERPSLLKIDVQGSELEVLRGAEGILNAADEILIECSFVEFYHGQPLIGEIISYLDGHGFAVSGIFSLVRDKRGQCLQADVLFVNVRSTDGSARSESKTPRERSGAVSQ